MDGRGEDLATYSCYLEILIVVFPLQHQEILNRPIKKVSLSPTLMARSAWKGCSHKLFIVIFHLTTLIPLIGLLWLTNCILLSLFLNFPFSLWHLFFFLPATLRSDIEPLPVGVLSCLTPVHIFAVPSPPPSRQWAFDWIHYLSCCSVCCCFSIREKEMNY